MEFIQATYHFDLPGDEAASLAEAVLLEQTVETPAAVARRHPFVRDHMMGSIRELTEDDGGGVRAVLSLPVVTASVDPAQFLNVLFGNSSLQPHVRLDDFSLPPSLANTFHGPGVGVTGLRERLGVESRPLTCSALKPVGLTTDALAALCGTLARGGVDVIKDDHYLADHRISPFEDRIRACLDAVAEAAAATGRRALYVPNLSGTPEAVRRQAERAQALGAEAVMVAPMLTGLPLLYELTREHLDVPVLAHPAFGGLPRIGPATLFGKLFRLFGADAVIFPNYGGRFSYSRATCAALADALRRAWPPFRPALPVPAGGMTVERAAELVTFFGRDVMLLIGGSLLEAGDDLLDRTRAFTEQVARAALTLNRPAPGAP